MRHGVEGSSPRRLAAPVLLLLLLLLPHVLSSECSPPTEPENGGYRCRPSPCQGLPHNTVIEYFCDEGFVLKGDDTFRTCQSGQWDRSLQISCRPAQGKEAGPALAGPALTVVLSTASCVALILLLVVLFVLVRPRLKSFHHSSRRERGVLGQPCSIMVGGVQVPLPSYEEAVHGREEAPRGAAGGRLCATTPRHREGDDEAPPTSVLLHQDTPSAAGETPPWGACAAPPPPCQGSGDDVLSTEEFCDDVPLLKDA